MGDWSIWSVLSIVNYAAVLVAIEHILRTRRDPRGMLAWILALLLLPLVGLVLFLLIGQVPTQRRVRRRLRRRRLIEPGLARRRREWCREDELDGRRRISRSQRRLMRLATRLSRAAITGGNDATIYTDAEASFLALSLAIEQAQSHAHLEYYIFAEDDTGRAVRDLLIRKAGEGVEVRLLLDAVGCLTLRRAFVRPMHQAGVKVGFFLPWGRARRFHVNFRNHRKLVVIDGRVGFMGSQNIGDEYLGRKRRLGPWRDTQIQVRGPCVAALQEIFAEDWHFAMSEDVSAERYFPPPAAAGDKLIQIVASGPDRRPNVLHQLLYAAVSDARHYVSLMTPYFVPDQAMLLALEAAALRGATVRLLLPGRSDQWLTLWAGRSFYEELLDAGVEIFEYEGGMLHSKAVVVDGRWAMLGSANMDVRSFRLNFEVTAVLYHRALAEFLQADFDALRTASRRVGVAEVSGRSYGQTLAAGLARLAAPML